VSVRIRLKRLGTKMRPYYRIVVMDSRQPRDGRALEEVGYYHPISPDEQKVDIKEDRVREWLSKGAQPSATVKRLLNKQNITVK
jgi:small subunit ribosomal protein S16